MYHMKNIFLFLSLFLFSTVFTQAQIPRLFWRYNTKDFSAILKRNYLDDIVIDKYPSSAIVSLKRDIPGFCLDTIKNYNDYILKNFKFNKKYFNREEAWFLSLLILPDSIKEYVMHHKNTVAKRC